MYRYHTQMIIIQQIFSLKGNYYEKESFSEILVHSFAAVSWAGLLVLIYKERPWLTYAECDCTSDLQVKYGVKSSKFIWAPCHVMCTLTAVLIG
jgi:hypothetical protein